MRKEEKAKRAREIRRAYPLFFKLALRHQLLHLALLLLLGELLCCLLADSGDDLLALALCRACDVLVALLHGVRDGVLRAFLDLLIAAVEEHVWLTQKGYGKTKRETGR